MKLKKTIKKIVALGTGLTMVGATILGASAADLANYPEQFIEDGVFDGILVVGEQAAASDVIGAVDIATNLQVESTTESTVNTEAGTSVSIEGDAYRIDESTDFLELNEQLDDVTSAQLDENDLNALESGTIRAKNTVSYKQRLSVPDNAQVEFTSDDDDDDEVAAKYLTFAKGSQVYEYEIEFPTDMESDIEDTVVMDDIEDQKITLLGKEYTITTAEIDDNDVVTMDLMGGALEATQQEYETKTYTLDGVDYEIEVVAISSDSELILSINGETTDKLVEDDTYELEDGTEIGVKTIIENEGTETGGGDIVTFYIGAQKMTLTDEGNNIEVGNEKIDGTTNTIDASGDSDEASISSITITFDAEDEYFVPVGGALSEQLEEADAIFGEAFDINYVGSETAETETVELSDSDEELTLTMTQHDGSEVKVPLANSSDSAYTLGNEDEKLHIDEGASDVDYSIVVDDYLVVGKNEKSTLLQYTDFDEGDDLITFKNVGAGGDITKSITANADDTGQGEISIGGVAYNVTVADTTGEDSNISVDLDGDSSFDGDTVDLYTQNRWKIAINTAGDADDNTLGLAITTPEELDNDPEETTDITLTAGADGSGNQEWSSSSVDLSNMQAVDDNSDDEIGMTDWGATIESNDEDEMNDLTLTLPAEQTKEVVSISSGVVEASETTAGDGEVTTTEINPISVGAAKLDTEVDDVAAQNAIVVGGPCANSAAASLMGNPEDCTAGFEEGKAIIQMYENDDNVALLVAGMTALDTRRAARALASGEEMSGNEVEVTGTTLTDIQVSAVEETEEADEDVADEEDEEEAADDEE